MNQLLLEQLFWYMGCIPLVGSDHFVTPPPDEKNRPLVVLQLFGNIQIDVIDDPNSKCEMDFKQGCLSTVITGK